MKQKKILLILLCVVFAVSMGLVATACAGQGDDGSSAPSEEAAAPADDATPQDETEGTDAAATGAAPKVVFQVFGTGAPYGAAMATALQAEADKRGWDYTLMDGKLDGVENAKCVEEAIAMNADVIISMPIDSAACSVAYQKAYDAGIPVLNETIKCLPDDDKLMVGYSGPNDIIHGNEAAELVYDSLPDGGGIIMLTTAPGQDTTVKRQQGFEEKIAELDTDGKFEILQTINTDSQKELAISVMNDMITKYGDKIKAVYAHEDYSAVGAAQALEESGFKPDDVYIVGVGGSRDGLAGVDSGQIDATTLQSPTISMVQTADLVDRIIAEGIKPGATLDPFDNWLNIPKVTKENVAEYLPGDW
jgi:ABC-type sugar transport system substrate-binding protein